MGPVHRRRVALVGCGLALAAPWALAAPATAPQLVQAQVEYEIGHYAQAFAQFAALADSGHRDAARIALQMWRYGPQLYATPFAAQPEQLSLWLALLACAPPRAMRCTAAVVAH